MRLYLLIYLCLISALLTGQVKNTGTPEINNFPRSVYDAGTQNWDITQDQEGFVYFANNDGVLMFDGIRWNMIHISNVKPIRSVYSSSGNKLYIGLLNDFGYLEPNDSSLYSFVSLRHLLPDWIVDFDEIWKIYELRDAIIFQSFDHLFIYRNGEIEVISPENRFEFAFLTGDDLYIQEVNLGLYELRYNQLIKLEGTEAIAENEIWGIIQHPQGGLLLFTSSEGAFHYRDEKVKEWEFPVNELLKENNVYSVAQLGEDYIAIGTILNGLYIIDMGGNILQHINREKGLINNTVLSMMADKSNNLWLGLDNGISYIEVNSPFSYFTGNDGLGTGYSAIVFNNRLYLGTNQGLWVKEMDTQNRTQQEFRMVKNTAGQVWTLFNYDGELLCGHNNGTFRVENDVGIQISSEEGAWHFISPLERKDLLIGGHYNGLVLFRKENGKTSFERKIEGFNVSSRFLVQDILFNIWVSHGAIGIFKISLDQNYEKVTSLEKYDTTRGLPDNVQNIVFEFENSILASTNRGLYEYNFENDRFQYSEEFNRLFQPAGRLMTFQTDSSGNIWYIAEEESGVMMHNQDSTYRFIKNPFNVLKNRYVNEFEFIYPKSSLEVYIGIDNGFAHFSLDYPMNYSEDFHAYITQVDLPYLDSIILSHQVKNLSDFIFPYRKNSIRFHFASPFFESLDELSFSYYLDGYSDSWSDWSSVSFRDFTNLREGEYSFLLKARNVYGVESNLASFNFIIDPPWRRTTLAYYLYVLFSVLFIVLIARIIHAQVKKSRERERTKHQEELKRKEENFQRQAIISEKEIIRLRNEKLRADMIYRDKELANQTMSIIQKNKLLSKLKEELQQMQKSTGDHELKRKMVDLEKRINKEIDNKKQNKVFKTYFEEVHEAFFERIKKIHPDLSSRELYLSAYIRMNLSSKEIAALQNITYRGVEIGRYRLRKKLNLSREVNLSTYLSNI